MRSWRSALPSIAALFMAWHVTAGAVVPLVMHVRDLSRTSDQADRSQPTATPEVCEHHAMPGAMCPMHSRRGAESSQSPGCAMVACDSATSDLFALLAWNAPFEPPLQLDMPLVSGERTMTSNVALVDLTSSPTTPPPRA